MHNARVLIVEDEWIAAEFLKSIIEQEEGVEVVGIVDTGQGAIDMCLQTKPDVIFMDIMLKDHISGSEAALQIRRRCQSEIIFLTAYSDPEMIDYAVESKAAGFLNKPYNEAEIVATLRLVLARLHHGTPASSSVVAPQENDTCIHLVAGYTYDRENRMLLKESQEVEIGPKALKVLDLLCQTPGKSVSNEQIMLHVWGEVVNDKTLRSLMFRIRSATDDALIKNISGRGYKVQLSD